MIKKTSDKNLGLGIAGMVAGVTALGIMNEVFGKMFGTNESTDVKHIAKDMMAGAMMAVLDHYQWKIDDLTQNIEKLIKDRNELSDELEQLKAKETKKK